MIDHSLQEKIDCLTGRYHGRSEGELIEVGEFDYFKKELREVLTALLVAIEGNEEI